MFPFFAETKNSREQIVVFLRATDSITVGFEGGRKRLGTLSRVFPSFLEAFYSFEVLKMNKTSGTYFFIKNVQTASFAEFQMC